MNSINYKELAEKAHLRHHQESLMFKHKQMEKAKKNFPKVLKKVYKVINEAANDGCYTVTFGDNNLFCFWRWNDTMRLLIREELEKQGFVCSLTFFNGLWYQDNGSLYISWV